MSVTCCDDPAMTASWPTGLRARIVATTAAAILVITAAMVGLVWVVLDRAVAANARAVLADRAAGVAAATTIADDEVRIDPGVGRDTVTWVFGPAGDLLAGPAGAALDGRATDLATGPLPAVVEVDDWLLRAQPLDSTGGQVLVVAIPISGYESTKHLAALVAVGLGVLAAAVATGLNAWAARRALVPVATMARQAQAWSARDLDGRFGLGPATDEITELGEVLDGLLDRVSHAIRAEQRLTAELAHELRTPLTVIRGQAELAALDLPAGSPSAARLEAIVATTDGLTSMVETLWATARGQSLHPATTTIADVLAEVVARTPGRPGVTVVTEPAPSARLAVPLALAVQALSPVLANAVRHARRRVVLIGAVTGARTVTLTVRDDGPGVRPVDRPHLFVPGWHGPDSPGAGLGLPLARRLARSGGGDLHHDDDHPATFHLTLPATDSTDGPSCT